MRTLQIAALILLSFSSCSHTNWSSSIKDWEGRHTDELRSHPMFSIIPVNERSNPDGVKIWTYNLRGRRLSWARGDCTFLFFVKDEVISRAHESGDCAINGRGPEK